MSSTDREPSRRLSDRHAKILMALYEAAEGTNRLVAYEDIVVRAFKAFPSDFQLRGYPEYPDASDIHKPLYLALSKAGYVTAVNKQFRLTPLGARVAQQLLEVADGTAKSGPQGRIGREGERELTRLRSTRAHGLVAGGEPAGIVDTDFYAFFKVSVRMKPAEFSGRLNETARLLADARESGYDVEDLMATERYLLQTFAPLVKEMRGERKDG